MSEVALNRLLARLEQSILSPDLRSSQYERNRLGINIEHARAMLLSLEKQAATTTRLPPAQRQRTQTDLQQKRDTIKKLHARLREYSDAAQDDESDEEFEDEGQEDLLSTYAPARPDVEDGLETGDTQGSRVSETQRQELRARRPGQKDHSDTQAATATAREELFQARPQPQQDPNLSHTETMMSHNRTQQEAITSSLLDLASKLKESSLGFQAALETDKEVVDRAGGGLDKSAQGMEGAGSKMSVLRKMSEGQGLWGRIKLYGLIFALWVACFLLVFAVPKLR